MLEIDNGKKAKEKGKGEKKVRWGDGGRRDQRGSLISHLNTHCQAAFVSRKKMRL